MSGDGQVGDVSAPPRVSIVAGRDPSALFQPFRLGPLELKNRICMAPMTRCFSPGGVPREDVAAYYRLRAANGVALIFTEGTWIPHPGASNDPNVPDFFGDEALAGWQRVVEEVHAAGGRIMPQLWHVGLQVKPAIEGLYDEAGRHEARQVGPSGVIGGIGTPMRQAAPPMTERQIEAVIDAFATSAVHAQRLGFDGAALHGGHGYLIDQFLWEHTNLRTDSWGGSIEARAKFAAELVREIKRRTGPDFPVVLRFSQWKAHDYDAKLVRTPQELERMLQPIVDAGVDLFDCSTRRFWLPEFEGSDLNLAGWTKQVTGVPSMTVGSVSLDQELMATLFGESAEPTSIDRLIEMLERGDFDLVAVGRALIADADWPRIVRDGRYRELKRYSAKLLETLL